MSTKEVSNSNPLDLWYVDVKQAYSSQSLYNIVRATDVEPDPELATRLLDLTVLGFYAGDLPGEDDWDAGLKRVIARLSPRFKKKSEATRIKNEAFLKIKTEYWKQGYDKDKNKMILEDGPYNADQAFQFIVDDYTRAGGFSDRRLFENVQIREALKLEIQLQELDEFDTDVAPYADVLKDTGLDSALNLTKFAPFVPIASKIIQNIAKLNKSDTVWDEQFTITTTKAYGQSKLREGIYIAIEALPDDNLPDKYKPSEKADSNQFDPTKLQFKDNRLYYPNAKGALAPWFQSYIIFNIYKNPGETPLLQALNEFKEQMPQEFWSKYEENLNDWGSVDWSQKSSTQP